MASRAPRFEGSNGLFVGDDSSVECLRAGRVDSPERHPEGTRSGHPETGWRRLKTAEVSSRIYRAFSEPRARHTESGHTLHRLGRQIGANSPVGDASELDERPKDLREVRDGLRTLLHDWRLSEECNSVICP